MTQTQHRRDLASKVVEIRYKLRQLPREAVAIEDILFDVADTLDGILEQLAWPEPCTDDTSEPRF